MKGVCREGQRTSCRMKGGVAKAAHKLSTQKAHGEGSAQAVSVIGAWPGAATKPLWQGQGTANAGRSTVLNRGEQATRAG
eukprot:362378-Chlamydomonas_euryale.AAC.1